MHTLTKEKLLLPLSVVGFLINLFLLFVFFSQSLILISLSINTLALFYAFSILHQNQSSRVSRFFWYVGATVSTIFIVAIIALFVILITLHLLPNISESAMFVLRMIQDALLLPLIFLGGIIQTLFFFAQAIAESIQKLRKRSSIQWEVIAGMLLLAISTATVIIGLIIKIVMFSAIGS